MQKKKSGSFMGRLAACLMAAVLAAAVMLQGAGDAKAAGGTIKVTFRLIGCTLSERGTSAFGNIDLAKGTGYMGAEYVTWIPTKTYTLPAGSKVYDLYKQALSDAGLKSVGEDDNYVETIYAPASCGGYELSEFTNGKNSGWMYTVNGIHPAMGLKAWELKNNDVVVWHYVNDYGCECEDNEFAAVSYAQYWNKWLEAEDIDPAVKNAGIKLNAAKKTLYLGDTWKLKATVTPKEAAAALSWESSNRKVAKVSQSGRVTALKKGTATITAKLAGGKKAACKITVKTAPVKKLTLNLKTKTLKKGGTIKLKATTSPKKTTDTLTWKSSNKKVAKVSASGKVTTLKKGKATITCKSSSGKKAACKITVK